MSKGREKSVKNCQLEGGISVERRTLSGVDLIDGFKKQKRRELLRR